MRLTLKDKIEEAKSTVSFFFEPDEKINYLPGQYLYITLPKLNYPDERGETRHFTISSSPTEKLIRITTRIREESGYKKTLNELQIGKVCEGRGPQGTFTLKENVKNSVFLAGGIGITPFRSMIKYNIDKKLEIPMNLIYSNSDSEFVFKEELDSWIKDKDYIRIKYLSTADEGRLDEEKLEKILSGWNLNKDNQTYWITGPNPFVNAMEELLTKLSIKEDSILNEKFIGY